MSSLVEIDAVEVLVINDNEVDPMSPYTNPGLQVSGQFKDVVVGSRHPVHGRGAATKELKMEDLCCGSHGLSLMITAIKGDTRHTVLFDTGPEEDGWQRNVERLRPNISDIELIHLSHWHRDHSGGMLRAIQMIKEAKANTPSSQGHLIADLHPSRPDYRGMFIGEEPISMEADPTFDEVEAAGAVVHKNALAHTVADDTFLVSGEIPRKVPYELGIRMGARFDSSTKKWEPDTLILDERLVMCNLKGKGIVVFTGCSHAGVVNASRHAMELGGGSPLYAVIGGYHLVDADALRLQDTVQDLKKLDPKLLLPGHCSGWRVKFEIEKQMPGRLAPCTVGTKFTL